MKRILWLSMLVLALPMAAFATSFDFSSGTFSSGTMTGSFSTSFDISITGSLNTISVDTGTLTLLSSCPIGFSGTCYSFTGGSVDVQSVFTDTLNGGILDKNGSSLAILAELTHNASVTDGTGTVSLTFKATSSGFSVEAGSIDISGHTPTIPEPSSLGLLGTGLAGVAAVMRRRKKT